jgi:hypothetical protein
MNDNVAIALDRIKFYARDALITVTQVSRVRRDKVRSKSGADPHIVYLQAVSFWPLLLS